MGEIKIVTSFNMKELDKIPPHMRRAGDTKILFDPKNEDEVEVAETQFYSLLERGFKAFKVKKSGDTGREVKKFNPKEGKYILVPEIGGG